jgi:hypothetical protein
LNEGAENELAYNKVGDKHRVYRNYRQCYSLGFGGGDEWT